MKARLRSQDWQWITNCNPDVAAKLLTDIIMDVISEAIPYSSSCCRSSHPWLTEECLQLVEEKTLASGTEFFPVACLQCSAGLLQAHNFFIERTRAKLRSLRRGSKLWWKLSNSILSRIAKPSASPLKKTDGSWAVDSRDKADVFAKSFVGKWSLPDPVVNIFSDLSIPLAAEEQQGFLRLRVRTAKYFLSTLRADSGTGPDLLPARVLKQCAVELALPVCLLARSIVAHSRWPASWCCHWLFPLHKKNTTADADNYRGVHLTAQLSKVVERIIGTLFLPRLERIGAFGPHQFAYRQQHGARDALLFLVLSWLLSFSLSSRVALYCSDVSGAFDHVERSRLGDKLRSFGVQSKIVDLMESWLRPRSARVVVSGQESQPFSMQDMVYQGTFFGPSLWNTYFSDSYFATRSVGFEEVIYADDLNAWKDIAPAVTDEEAFELTRTCQSSLHDWGKANRVCFDATKESMHILSRSRPAGAGPKILGINVDTK